MTRAYFSVQQVEFYFLLSFSIHLIAGIDDGCSQSKHTEGCNNISMILISEQATCLASKTVGFYMYFLTFQHKVAKCALK